jgi:GT2 family glycosyltransferase
VSSTIGEVSVIVLNYNGEAHLRECLSSLGNLTPIVGLSIRVICADNGSIDHSLELVRREFPWVEIIAFEKNLGFTGGYNLAIENITSEYIALLNNDTKVTPDWLDEMVASIKYSPDVAIVGSKVLTYGRENILQYAGGKFTILGNGYILGLWEEDNASWSIQGYTGFAMGASFLIKREIFLELGGFDDRYYAYNEETDLCWRAWLAGYKVIYAPKAIVYHKLGATGGVLNSPLMLSLVVKNRLATLIKNLEPTNVVFGLMLSVIFELYRLCFFLAHRNFQSIKAILTGIPGFLRELPGTLKRRTKIQRTRKVHDADLYALGALSTFRDAYIEHTRLGVMRSDSSKDSS